jgi:small subunit ribosomal protein S1
MLEDQYGPSGVPEVLSPNAPAEPTNHQTNPSAAAEASAALPASAVLPAKQDPEPLKDKAAAVPQPEDDGARAAGAANQEASGSAEIDNLFASMDQVSLITPGELVRCRVLKVTESEVIVDIGLKSEAALSLGEFAGQDGKATVAPGDLVDIYIESYDEEEDSVVASHKKAVNVRVWEEIEKAYRDQTNLKGRVVARTKGGLEVDVGVRAFLPASQADLRPLRNIDSLIGEEIACKVAKLDRKRNNVVVSRRAALEEELNRRRSELMEKLVEGAVLTGRVKNLVDYGAFVDLGGMDGLLHITDLSWGRVTHPSEVVRVGQELKVKILKYVPEKDRVSLGLKQLSPDPWEQVNAAYRAGDRAMGRVVSVTDYGAFVELEPGIEGLIHVSEMSWSKRPKHPSKVVSAGERVEVAILDVNAPQRRISLSLKQTLPDPWTSLAQRLAEGAVVEGRVRNLTDFGAFVEIEEGVDGLVHLSDLSSAKRVNHPSEVLKKGQAIQVKVLALDPEHRRLSLGLKQLQPDIWETFFAQTQVGDVLRGKVVRMAPFGAFVELREGIEGLCHISEMDEVHASGPVAVGSHYQFRVIRVNPGEKRIGLSLNGVEQEPAPASPAEPAQSAQDDRPEENHRAAAAQTSTPSPEEPSTAVAADTPEPAPASGSGVAAESGG